MRNESYIRRDKHYIIKLHVHWVFVSNSRRRVFGARDIDVPRSILADVSLDAQATRVEMDGDNDHMHFLVKYPSKLAISSLVNGLKDVSSCFLRQQRPDPQALLERRAEFAQLVCFILRRSAHQDEACRAF